MEFEMGSGVFDGAVAILEETGAPVYTFSQINPDGLAFFVFWRGRVVEAWPGRDVDLKAMNGGIWPGDTHFLKKEVIEAANEEIRFFLEDHAGEWPEGAIVAVYGVGGRPVLTTVEEFIRGPRDNS